MTTVLEDSPPQTHASPAQRLRTTMAGVRLSVTSLGVRKTLTPQQKAQAADTFGAEGAYMSAAKKLLDTSHPAFKRVTGVKNQAVQFWRGLSLPFPEPGLRLIRQSDIEAFNAQMTALKAELDDAVEKLNDHFGELVSAARQRLGRLFNAADYPDSLIGMFDIQWDFPSVEPPDYLRRLKLRPRPQLCFTYSCRGVEVTRQYKTFLATSKLVSGPIRVIILRHEDGGWAWLGALLLYGHCGGSTEHSGSGGRSLGHRRALRRRQGTVGGGSATSPQCVVEHRLLELESVGHTLVELCSWDQAKSKLADRSNRSWDNPARRPSHADRRRKIAREMLQKPIYAALPAILNKRKFRKLLDHVIALAA